MKKFLICMLICLICSPVYSQRSITPSYVSDAYDLQMWLRGNFIYHFDEANNYWKSAESFLQTRRGDCKHFAVLSSRVFTELMIPNEIVVVQLAGIEMPHAITVFREGDVLHYMDNGYYKRVGVETTKELLEKSFPTWVIAKRVNSWGSALNIINRYEPEIEENKNE